MTDWTFPPFTARHMTEQDGLPAGMSVTLTPLAGGRQEGVTLVELDTGAMRVIVVPARGMNVLRAHVGDVRLGWDSPVTEVVNPAFIRAESRGGAGWLEGFNELVTRCGFEWMGHPGMDGDELLTLHGRASNSPAHAVSLTVDPSPPHAVTLTGIWHERAFKRADFTISASVRVLPGAVSFSVHDELTNNADYPSEYMVLYHNNFGPPLLGQGSVFAAPIGELSPFNARAASELDEWNRFRGPEAGYDETVFNITPRADAEGRTLAVLHDQAGERGVAVGFDTTQLPRLTLWKNTDTLKRGYVAGIEPGTSFCYNRARQRPLGLIPVVGPGERRRFDLDFAWLGGAGAVGEALARVASIQGDVAAIISPQAIL